MSQMLPQVFEGNQIRVIEDNNEFWVIAKDVAKALDYPESSLNTINKLIQHVPSEWVDRKPIPGSKRAQTSWCLSEQGLYFFLARSDKPKAIPFQKWIAGDILPSIRKTGSYSVEKNLSEDIIEVKSVNINYQELYYQIKTKMELCLAINLPKKQLFHEINNCYKSVTGEPIFTTINVDELLTDPKPKLEPKKEPKKYLIASKLGKQCSPALNAREVNTIFKKLGLQSKIQNRWNLTNKGEKYGGTILRNQITWEFTPGIINILDKYRHLA